MIHDALVNNEEYTIQVHTHEYTIVYSGDTHDKMSSINSRDCMAFMDEQHQDCNEMRKTM